MSKRLCVFDGMTCSRYSKTTDGRNIMNHQQKKAGFFCHKECEYFPCHTTEKPEDFNCLFCYCPLYALGERCGGNYSYTMEGIKNCSQCLFPHERSNYSAIVSRFSEIVEMIHHQDRKPIVSNMMGLEGKE